LVQQPIDFGILRCGLDW